MLAALVFLFAAETTGTPLALEDAIEQAQQKNPQVAIASADAARAATLVKQGYALFYPTLDSQAVYQANDRRLLTPETEFDFAGETYRIESQVFQPWWTLRWQLQVQQNLSFHGPALPLLRQAKAGADAARFGESAAKADIAFAVARAYYAALTADTVVTVAEDALAAAKELQRVADIKKQNGRATEAEVLRAKVRVAESNQALVGAKRGAEEARETLADLIGSQGPFTLSRPARPAEPSTSVMALRPELAAASAAVRGTEAASVAAFRNWYPTIALQGRYSGYETSDGKLFGQPPESYALIGVAQMSIFDGSLKYWQVREAKQQVRAARAREDAAKLAAEADERRARRRVAAAKETEALAKERLTLASKARELVAGQYELGVATQLERLDADSAFAAARREAAASELEADLAVLELQRALGLTLVP